VVVDVLVVALAAGVLTDAGASELAPFGLAQAANSSTSAITERREVDPAPTNRRRATAKVCQRA